MERMMLYSRARVNTLSVVIRTCSPVYHIGFITSFPSMIIRVSVLDINRISSCTIPYWIREFSRTRTKEDFSVLLIIISISFIESGLEWSSLIYWVVLISWRAKEGVKAMIISCGISSSSRETWCITFSKIRATHCISVIDPSTQFFRGCRILTDFLCTRYPSWSIYKLARTLYEPRSIAIKRSYSCMFFIRKGIRKKSWIEYEKYS